MVKSSHSLAKTSTSKKMKKKKKKKLRSVLDSHRLIKSRTVSLCTVAVKFSAMKYRP